MAFAAILGMIGLILFGQAVWIHAKAALAQVLLERAFARSLASGRPEKPWSWMDSYPAARISIPRLGRSIIALQGASGQALAFGPAHVSGTPEAGEPGTAVYAAHRDTHFAFLGAVRTGDRIEVEGRNGRTIAFRVTGTRVAPWNASGIDPYTPGRNLVLATCWPLDAITSGPLRFLVQAEALEEEPHRD